MDERRIFPALSGKEDITEVGEKKVRLLGISISNFDDQEAISGKVCKYRQLPLPFKFPDAKDKRNESQLW